MEQLGYREEYDCYNKIGVWPDQGKCSFQSRLPRNIGCWSTLFVLGITNHMLVYWKENRKKKTFWRRKEIIASSGPNVFKYAWYREKLYTCRPFYKRPPSDLQGKKIKGYERQMAV